MRTVRHPAQRLLLNSAFSDCLCRRNQPHGVGFRQGVRLHNPFGVYHAYTRPFIVLGVVGAAPLALADAWQAKPALEPGSPPDCKQADVSHLLFDLADTGNELSVKTSSGEAFSAPIGPDGSVKTT